MEYDTLSKIKMLLIDGKYVLSSHARNQLFLDGLEIRDVISSVLNANNWYKKEKDEKGTGFKYTFISASYYGIWIYSVGKIIKLLDTETYFLVITAKRSE